MKIVSARQDVEKLVSFVTSIDGIEELIRERSTYCHMGATICDTILQAGLNYKTVVAPRINRLLERWPNANSTSKFLYNIRRYDLYSAIDWLDDEKPRRIIGLTEFLANEDLETEADVRRWMHDEYNVESLRKLRGVGPKTTDYLKMLVGISTVPVDRHVRNFLSKAGVTRRDYEETQSLFHDVADVMSIDRSSFDYAVWLYESSNSRSRAA